MKPIHTYSLLLFLAALLMTGCTASRKPQTETSGSDRSSPVLGEKEQITVARLFYTAAKEKMLGNVDIAANLYNQCIRIDPNNHAALYEVANIYNSTGRYEDALTFARKAAALDPSNKWYRLLLAKVYMNNRLYEDAAKIYRSLLKEQPDNLEYAYELAATQITAGKLEDAIKTYQELEDRMGVREEIIVQKERIYLRLGKTQEAIAEIRKLIEAYPEEARYYGMLAELYFSNGMDQEALETFGELQKIDPDNPIVHFSLADYYRSIGEKEKSFSELKMAFGQPEASIDTKIKILLSFYSISETYPELTGQALELCEILVKVHPGEAKAFAMQGDFLYREKKLPEARDAFQKALSLDPQKYAVWSQYLLIQSELEDFQAMARESAKALELFPSQPFIYLLNGIAHIQNKQLEKAIEVLNAGIDFAMDDPMMQAQFYANMGDAYHSMKDHERSDRSYNRALELEPNNVYVLNNYSYYLSLRGDSLEKAEEMSVKSNELEPENASFQDTYGWILFRMERYADAEKWLKKALETSGYQNSTIIEHYGDVLFKLGKPEEALGFWEKSKAKGNTSPLLERKITDRRFYDQ